MKRFFMFFRSMKFGIILLLLVVACSLAGSLLPQGREVDWYMQNYAGTANVILKLRLNDVFSSWYFLLLLGLLCANLTLCSVARLGKVRNTHKNAFRTAPVPPLPTGRTLSEAAKDKLCAYLAGKRYRLRTDGDTQIFYKNTLGYYGSFAVHLSILLTLILGALALYLAEVSDHSILPGDSLALADGTVLTVDDFRITDETGRLDFASTIHVKAPDGAQAGPQEISVNYPLSFRSYKYYQQTYGTAGSVTVADTQTGGTDVFSLTEPCFLSIDGYNGVWYEALHPAYIRDEDGHFTLITSTSGEYADPIYQVLVASGGDMTPVLVLPGETIRVEDISFTFNEPVAYPGIRIKRTPALIQTLLYAAFVLMVLGFWLCFFHEPTAVAVYPESYILLGAKTAGIQLEIDMLLRNTEGGAHTPC